MKGSKLFFRALELVYPEKCPFCANALSEERKLCASCAEKLPRADRLFLLGNCFLDQKLLFAAVPLFYRGEVREAVKRFKFRDEPGYAVPFSGEMQKALELCGKARQFDVVTCVPMYFFEKAKRGYNQAELLAKELSERLSLPYSGLLRQVRRKKAQHTLSPAQRRQNVKNVYAPRNKEQIVGKRILLCDDIVTTGSTLRECGRVLYRAGAKEVFCAVFAVVN